MLKNRYRRTNNSPTLRDCQTHTIDTKCSDAKTVIMVDSWMQSSLLRHGTLQMLFPSGLNSGLKHWTLARCKPACLHRFFPWSANRTTTSSSPAVTLRRIAYNSNIPELSSVPMMRPSRGEVVHFLRLVSEANPPIHLSVDTRQGGIW